jgi:hypothetical protein
LIAEECVAGIGWLAPFVVFKIVKCFYFIDFPFQRYLVQGMIVVKIKGMTVDLSIGLAE